MTAIRPESREPSVRPNWSVEMERLLRGGRWHYVRTLVSRCIPLVKAEEAMRRRAIGNGDDYALRLQRARRSKVKSKINGMIRLGKLLTKGDGRDIQIRMIGPKRLHPDRLSTAPKYQKHSGTSEAAYAALDADTLGRMQGLILGHLSRAEYDGSTDQETATHLGVPENSVRPRRIELEQMGFVIDDGIRRHTRSGREAVAWVTKEYANADVSK